MDNAGLFLYKRDPESMPVSVHVQIAEKDFATWWMGVWRRGYVTVVTERAILATLGRTGWAVWWQN
jgi:hypothetical protein